MVSFLSDEFINRPPTTQQRPQRRFEVGELIWGPRGIFSSWPGKVTSNDDLKAKVFFFGNKETSEVEHSKLKSLMEGLDEHHKERKNLRK